MKSIVAIFFVISSLVHSGFAQHCYQCDSFNNQHCGDTPKFDASLNTGSVVDCADFLSRQSGAQAGAGSSSGYNGQGQGQAGASAGANNKGNKQHCYKAVVKNEHGAYGTYRACSVFTTEKQLCDHLKSDSDILPPGSKLETCKICSGDLCNSARHLGVTFTLLLLPIIAFIKNF